MSETRKLTLSINGEMANRLTEMANGKGITVSEQLRRTIGLISIIDGARETPDETLIIGYKDQSSNFQQIHILDPLYM